MRKAVEIHQRPLITPLPRWVTFNEFEAQFARNLHRARLIAGLRRACVELRQNGCGAVFVGGSFTTDKEYPGDYDACFHPVGVRAELDPLLIDRIHELERKEKYFGDWLIGRPEEGPPGEWYRYLAFDDRTGQYHDMYGIKLRLDELIQK